MWSEARFCLRLTTQEFYALTPLQFDLLMDRFREDRSHREMVAAFTTEAVYAAAGALPASHRGPITWMPSHPEFRAPAAAAKSTPQQSAAREAYMAKVAQVTAELRARQLTGKTGPLMRKLGLAPKPERKPRGERLERTGRKP